MSNTKWNELRFAMLELDSLRPRWRTKDINGAICHWDGDWFYHLKCGGYETIEWLEIEILSTQQDNEVLAALRKIHLPGKRVENGFRIYGFATESTPIDYL